MTSSIAILSCLSTKPSPLKTTYKEKQKQVYMSGSSDIVFAFYAFSLIYWLRWYLSSIFQMLNPKHIMSNYSIRGGLDDKITNGRQKYEGCWKQTIRVHVVHWFKPRRRSQRGLDVKTAKGTFRTQYRSISKTIKFLKWDKNAKTRRARDKGKDGKELLPYYTPRFSWNTN